MIRLEGGNCANEEQSNRKVLYCIGLLIRIVRLCCWSSDAWPPALAFASSSIYITPCHPLLQLIRTASLTSRNPRCGLDCFLCRTGLICFGDSAYQRLHSAPRRKSGLLGTPRDQPAKRVKHPEALLPPLTNECHRFAFLPGKPSHKSSWVAVLDATS